MRIMRIQDEEIQYDAHENTGLHATHKNTDFQAACEFLTHVLLTIMQHMGMARVQHTKYDSHALHGFLLLSSTFHVTHKF